MPHSSPISVAQSLAPPRLVPGIEPDAQQAIGLQAVTLKFLSRCTYRPMTEDSDKELLLRWRWENYRSAGRLESDSITMEDFEDGLDDLPTARTVAMYVDGNLASAIRVHAINEDVGNVGIVHLKSDRVEGEVRDGVRFLYASRWISDPRYSATMPAIVSAMRITCLAAGYHKADKILSSSRENHVKMYHRIYGSETWTREPEPLEGYNDLFHLVCSDYHDFRKRIPIDRQAYFSSQRERDAMFSPDASGSSYVFPSAPEVMLGIEAAAY